MNSWNCAKGWTCKVNANNIIDLIFTAVAPVYFVTEELAIYAQ